MSALTIKQLREAIDRYRSYIARQEATLTSLKEAGRDDLATSATKLLILMNKKLASALALLARRQDATEKKAER